ncbi:MAG: hypothetical protein ACTS6G_06010 [Candidatus Hodgkinia cicadicola]
MKVLMILIKVGASCDSWSINANIVMNAACVIVWSNHKLNLETWFNVFEN